MRVKSFAYVNAKMWEIFNEKEEKFRNSSLYFDKQVQMANRKLD